MKLVAHVVAGGHIQSLIAMPDGDLTTTLTPEPGAQVCALSDHDFKGDTVDLDQLSQLRDTHGVEVTPAQGRLVRRER